MMSRRDNMTEWDYLKKHTDPEEWEVLEQFIEPIEEIRRIFQNQGHSGMSAPWFASRLAQIVENILTNKPLVPIHEGEEEWVEIAEEIYRSKRCSGLFKERNRPPTYLDAIIWVEPSGITFTGRVNGITSRQYIKYPFYPKHFFVKIRENPETGDYIIIDKPTLRKALKYYRPFTEEADEFLRRYRDENR